MQADHYITRLRETDISPINQLIDRVLEANGYARGGATVDFQFVTSIDDAYMTSLYLMHEKNTGRKIDSERSKMHNVRGAVTGKLTAIFYTVEKDDAEAWCEQARDTLQAVSPQLLPERVEDIVRAARLAAEKNNRQFSSLFLWQAMLYLLELEGSDDPFAEQVDAGVNYLSAEAETKDTAKGILRALQQGDSNLRAEAAGMALFAKSDYDTIVVPGLIDALKDSDAGVRRMAILILGHYGTNRIKAVNKAARKVLGELNRVSRDGKEHETVRREASEALEMFKKLW